MILGRTLPVLQEPACSGRRTQAVAACRTRAAVVGADNHILLLPAPASLGILALQLVAHLGQHLRLLRIHKLVLRMRASSSLLPPGLRLAEHTAALQDWACRLDTQGSLGSP